MRSVRYRFWGFIFNCTQLLIDLIAEFMGLTLKQIQKLQKLAAKQSQMPKSKK